MISANVSAFSIGKAVGRGGGGGGAQWHILMSTTGTKRLLSGFANPGTTNFLSASKSSSGANGRTAIGDGDGVYQGFFDCINITKFAYINGSGDLQSPSSNSIYAVYEPDYTNSRETSGNESVYDILKRIGTALTANNYLSQSSHKNTDGDSAVLAVSPGITEMVGGSQGYSAKRVSSSSSNIGGNNVSGHADFFCILGENFASDHDTQALCFYDGNLANGNPKADGWRYNDPAYSSWSYWGNDFHTNSATQNIGANLQTNMGANTYSGVLYILAYGELK